MRITWLGHSAFRVEFDGHALLIDPFLTGNPGFNGDHAAVTAGISHILITHGHGDHVGDTIAIAKETGATVVTNYELCMWLASQGVAKVDPMNTGGTTDQGGFTVTLVRADHSAGMGEAGVAVPLGFPNGLIVKAKGQPTLYHFGDTDIFSDMGLIAELHQPRIGLVPIGDRFTMGAEVAALAVKRYFDFDAVLPCHYASFPPLAANADAFVTAMQGHKTRVHTPKSGEAVEL
ncbi:metal-dependent hydrolase [Labrys wisconsinensis]|uniref:UPF0173 metal-dependent hydrolase QO011_001704 n=1 Tax=Labrys wisconsinensis TaxID=425677 RepID=A0ABU0J5Z1_9HYPH|nr:metal-dependent hydrolase [Labrys wisconsinensis]MDQ0468704.1 L-ascorbate metabolism protein UlaG (beta-lactamase superfamily) [Labrys wisconsinensis]